MISDTNTFVDLALQAWAELVTKGREGQTLDDWRLKEKADELNEARTLDPSGLTAYMLLRDLFRNQMRERTITMWECVQDMPGVQAQIKPFVHLWDALNVQSVMDEVQGFRDSVLAGCVHYGVTPDEDFFSWLSDSRLSNLRNAALRSLEKLQTHQFSQGVGREVLLGYNPQILEFWNVNSLLRAAQGQMVEGITLALIRDPVALHSFFAVVVKNGENISILTDRANDPHPDFKHMARLDRDMVKRWNLNWFPYELLDIAVTDDDKRMYAKARTSLVPINTSAVPLKAMKDIHSASLVWLMLLFALIQKRFGGSSPLLLEQLSYTGEMVREPHALMDAQSALVREGRYRPLELPRLDHEAMRDPGNAAGFERRPTRFNEWMIDRYGPQVPEQVFNLVGASEVAGLLPDLEQGALTARANDRARWDDKAETHHHLELGSVDPVDFGIAEHVAKNRVWNARKSQCAVIQRLADREFLETRSQISAWFEARVRARKETLLNAMAAGELALPKHGQQSGFGLDLAWGERVQPENALTLAEHVNHCWFAADRFSPGHLGGSPMVKLTPVAGWREHWLCPDTDVKATIFGHIEVNCPQGLAALCGVAVADLPWPMQHWYPRALLREFDLGPDRPPGLGAEQPLAAKKLYGRTGRPGRGRPRLQRGHGSVSSRGRRASEGPQARSKGSALDSQACFEKFEVRH